VLCVPCYFVVEISSRWGSRGVSVEVVRIPCYRWCVIDVLWGGVVVGVLDVL